MVPVLIVVKILDGFGLTDMLASFLSPAMKVVGLPDALGIVLATAMLTNMYTAMAVFLSLSNIPPLTIADITVLTSMMLLAHSLPVEGAIARAAGLPWSAILALRVGGAFLFGFILHKVYHNIDSMQKISVMLWQPKTKDDSLLGWILGLVETLVGVFIVLALLMVLLALLKKFGIEKWIHLLLSPFLRLLGIGKEATNVTVVGMILGLTFGGGLLIDEARSGRVSKRDIRLSMAFICLCHSLIDDTIIVLLLGADVYGVLWARLIFAITIIAIVARTPLGGKSGIK